MGIVCCVCYVGGTICLLSVLLAVYVLLYMGLVICMDLLLGFVIRVYLHLCGGHPPDPHSFCAAIMEHVRVAIESIRGVGPITLLELIVATALAVLGIVVILWIAAKADERWSPPLRGILRAAPSEQREVRRSSRISARRAQGLVHVVA